MGARPSLANSRMNELMSRRRAWRSASVECAHSSRIRSKARADFVEEARLGTGRGSVAPVVQPAQARATMTHIKASRTAGDYRSRAGLHLALTRTLRLS